MRTKNISLLIASLITAGIFIGCSEDFLNKPPIDSIVDANFFKTDGQILASTADLYSSVWKDYCDQAYWKIGDVKAGLVYSPWTTSPDIRDFSTFNVTGLSAGNVNAYRSFYQVVGLANTVIHNINVYAGPAVTDKIRNHAIAEARFMRATAYSFLVMNYGPVPIIEDNTKYLSNPAVKCNTVESVWEFIRRDYRFASKNLTTEPIDAGRLTKWSAEGMLARTFLTMAGVGASMDQSYLDSAKYYADRVITQSGKALETDYANLYMYPYDNKNESLFELQWVYTSNPDLSYKYANTMVSQITPDNSVSANNDGWGSGVGATRWMLNMYDSLISYHGTKPGFTLDKRLKSTFILPGFAYPELTITATSPFMDANHVVQYVPSNVTAANPTDGQGYNFAWIKKYVIGKVKDSGKQNYPNNTYMLRLAELYLIYAEADVLKSSGEIKTNDKAVDYFNKVHTRAGLPALDATINSLTWDVIFRERVKEFAMEGRAWYDLVRLHYYNPDHAYNILKEQTRGQFLTMPNQWPNPTGWKFYTTSFGQDVISVDADNFLMGIPQVEKAQAPSLSDVPVPYEFPN